MSLFHLAPTIQTAAWTLPALVAFAGNSVLCRAALAQGPDGVAPISPEGFTGVRLLAGAVALSPVLLLRRSGTGLVAGLDVRSVLALVAYAAAFSLSYVTLPAGAGALLLFGAVQITMVGAAALRREPLGPRRLLGMLVAFGGLVRLVTGAGAGATPGGSVGSVGSVDPAGAALMAVAGIAWAVYTLRGRGGTDPTRTTALNFAGAAPVALALIAWSMLAVDGDWQPRGVWLAVASGAVTSGAGYAIWYRALDGHSRTSAAAVQLSVPIIAALGGALYLGEALTRPLLEATALTLGGIAFALWSPRT